MKFKLQKVIIGHSIIAKLNAQEVILFEQDSVSQINIGVDILNMSEDFPLDLFYKNNTSDTIKVNWRREFGANCPLEWDIVVADQNLTFTPEINESLASIPMNPSDSNFIIRQLVYPRSIAGCCDIKIILSL